MRKKENPKNRKNKHVPLVAMPIPDDLITYLESSDENSFGNSFLQMIPNTLLNHQEFA
jgi:hypothetical protein